MVTIGLNHHRKPLCVTNQPAYRMLPLTAGPGVLVQAKLSQLLRHILPPPFSKYQVHPSRDP